MAHTTTFRRMRQIDPVSETHWRGVAAWAHRIRGYPGDESAARTHENEIYGIRKCQVNGSSRMPRNCPQCLERGMKYWLLFMGGLDQCGTCGWPRRRAVGR